MRLASSLVALLTVTLAACAPHAGGGGARGPSPSAADATFDALARRFLREYLERSPVAATAAGEHAFDGRWPDTTAAGEQDYLAFLDRTRAELDAVPDAELDAGRRIDAAILKNQIGYQRFQLTERRADENEPLAWTGLVGDGFDPLLTREFAPLPERLRSVRARLEGLPAVLASARQRLGRPARVQTETAIRQTQGLVALCTDDIPAAAAALPEAERAPLLAAAARGAKELEAFGAFLSGEVLPRSDGSFRVGRARFGAILRYELEDDVGPDGLVAGAEALLESTQAEMLETARELWPTLFPGEAFPAVGSKEARHGVIARALAALAADRPTNATIVDEARAMLGEATRFVREHDLVTVTDDACRVVEMPEYRRGVSIAYCDSTGPLETKQESVYTISPTPADWSAERSASFYREYNRSMLRDLTVHEAMPGHFLQAMHANRTKDDLRAVFASGAFVEGWAVYGEWLMAKHGFGGPKVRLQRQKMALRVAANALLDHGVHAGTLDEAGALALMQRAAFQEEGEAVAKWNRARLSAGQLSTYYYGFAGVLGLRQAAERRPGFTERGFHDRLLAHGSPAVRHLRVLLGR